VLTWRAAGMAGRVSARQPRGTDVHKLVRGVKTGGRVTETGAIQIWAERADTARTNGERVARGTAKNLTIFEGLRRFQS